MVNVLVDVIEMVCVLTHIPTTHDSPSMKHTVMNVENTVVKFAKISPLELQSSSIGKRNRIGKNLAYMTSILVCVIVVKLELLRGLLQMKDVELTTRLLLELKPK